MQQEPSSQSTLAAIRDRLINNSLLILAVLSLPALAASLARSIQTGWHFALTAQVVLVILLWCLVFLRHTLSTSVLGWGMLGILFAMGVSGFLSYGVSSEGTLLLVLMVVIDLWTIAQQSVKSAIPSAHSHTLTLHEEPPTAPLPIFADPGRIKQAIDNLLTNAIKFTDPGGQIWVRAYGQDEAAMLEVQDTGRGITPSALTNLFKPFSQISREEQKGGLGLGLVLVKGIVELHDGQVSATSPGEGRGSCFTIKLPITE